MVFKKLLVLMVVILSSILQLEGANFPASALPVTEAVSCSLRKEIDPCSCRKWLPGEGTSTKQWIQVICQKMNSFAQVIEVLQNKFDKSVPIMLYIEHSNLTDMGSLKFADMNFTTITLSLDNNMLKNFTYSSFEGLSDVRRLSLADNQISEFPGGLFRYMPKIENLEISRTRIKTVAPSDFENLRSLRTLVFSECNLTSIENGTFPPTLTFIHLGSNNLTGFNRTIAYQNNANWLHLQNNRIENLEGELPDHTRNMKLTYLDISGNQLNHLPHSFHNLAWINHLLAYRNKINQLDNTLSTLTKLVELDISENRIQMLSPSEFAADTSLKTLKIAYNEITSLNGSLLPLHSLSVLNATHNQLTEFSLNEVNGLTLNTVHLSYNKISKFVGYIDNSIESETRIVTLNLDNNELKELDGSLSGVQGLTYLNISFNKLTSIPPQFLHGLDQLHYLDISHNHLHSLQDTSKAILPTLEELHASYNDLHILSDDFNGFPILCHADLSHNKIRTIKIDFAEKTHCKLHTVSSTLRIYVQGNPLLCDDSMKDVIRAIEVRYNDTEFHGSTQCSPPKEELKYNVSNTDSSPITVITLDKK